MRDARPRLILMSAYRDAPRAVWRAHMVILRGRVGTRRHRRALAVVARWEGR